jgi:spore maturation protein CgeB
MSNKDRFLILGSNHPVALELVFSRELRNLGIINEVLGIQNIFLAHYNKSFLNKVIYRFGISKIESKIQDIIKAEIQEFKPKTVLVFKGMEIKPKTLIWIKSKGIQVVNYNPDSPFIFSGRGSGNKNVTNSITLFDHYITYDKSINKELEKRSVKSAIIPFGFDSCSFNYKDLTEKEEVLKLCFLGNADKFRIDFLEKLAQRGVKIDLYGENWSTVKLHKNICTYGPRYGLEFWSTLQKYAIQLNLLRPHNLDSHNMRCFDVPGAGGIMLAPRTPDHQTYFTEFSEVFLFSDLSEALQHIQFILNLSFSERRMIRHAARFKAIEHHTYSHRVKQLIQYLDVQ